MAVQEHDSGPTDLDAVLHPYRNEVEAYLTLPRQGLDRDAILEEMRALAAREEDRWREGYACGAVYNGDAEHIAFLREADAIQAQANPLHPDLFPSMAKYEGEVVSMTAHMVGGGTLEHPVGSPRGICGSVTSGGS